MTRWPLTCFLVVPLLVGCTPADDTDVAVVDPCADAASCVDEARYTELITALAVPRYPGSPGWSAAQDLCATTFADAGFEVERYDYGTGVNVIGRKPGADASAEIVLLSAHYDSVADCTGADDNASGVAGVLVAAEALASSSGPRELQVACWDEEEDGLIGSLRYADRLADEGRVVALSEVFEMIGYRSSEPDSQSMPNGFDLVFPDAVAAIEANAWRGDFILLAADERASEAVAAFAARGVVDGLPDIALSLTAAQSISPLYSTLQRSDHASFWYHGWPAVMINDTAEYRNGAYHCSEEEDSLDRLDLGFATRVVRGAVAAAQGAATTDR